MLVNFALPASLSGWTTTGSTFTLSRDGEDAFVRFEGILPPQPDAQASAQSPALTLELAGSHGIRLRVRGDGQRYALQLTVPALPGVQYFAQFETESGAWTTISIPFGAFRPEVYGKRLRRFARLIPRPNLRRVKGFSLHICAGQPGPFTLDIADISTFSLESILGFTGQEA